VYPAASVAKVLESKWEFAGLNKQAVQVRSGEGEMQETIWMAEQFRAGQILNKVTFNTKEEAEEFTRQMGKIEPDIFWKVEAIPVKMVWN
jgi:hypothetical protein